MSKKRSIIWQISSDQLKKVVVSSDTLANIIRSLNLVVTGSAYKMLKKRLAEEGIDYSHIKLGLNTNRGRRLTRNCKYSLDDILIEHCIYSRSSLKRRLIKEGLLKNQCSLCGQAPQWNGKLLIMILDHINGINDDNRLFNLRLLCPNCNSQTNTFSGRNKHFVKSIKPKKICEVCGNFVKYGKKCCSQKCYSILQRKVIRPDKEILENDLRCMSYVAAGRKYGVSDNAIRKWLKAPSSTLVRT